MSFPLAPLGERGPGVRGSMKPRGAFVTVITKCSTKALRATSQIPLFQVDSYAARLGVDVKGWIAGEIRHHPHHGRALFAKLGNPHLL